MGDKDLLLEGSSLEEVKSVEIKEDEYVTLAELGKVEIIELSLPKFGGKRVRFKNHLPLELVAKLQAKAGIFGKNPDWNLYYKTILKEIMVVPRVDNIDDLDGMDGMTALKIVGEVFSEPVEEFTEGVEAGKNL